MTMTEKPSQIQKLSVLIPVYNEIRTLKTLLNKVLDVPLPCERELVIVDDGSSDGSRELLREFEEKHDCIRVFFHQKNGGKGKAIRTAIRKMTGDWAIIQDADLEYDPRDWETMLVPVQEGIADAVFGSRFLTGRYRRAMYFWHTMANNILTTVSNMFNDLNLTDMETCYKLVRADILKDLNLRANSFDLEPELTAKLARWGARIYEVPISYQGRSYAEGKKIGPMDAAMAMWAMFRFRFLEQDYTKHEGFLILQAVRKARKFNKWLFDQFSEYLGGDVLEAGCGIGNLTELLLDRRRAVAIDNEKFYVDRLNQAYGHLLNFEAKEADLTDLDQLKSLTEKGLFDSVICANVLEHIEEDVKTLENFKEILKPGGRIAVLVPAHPDLYSDVDETLGHCRRYTKRDLEEKMIQAGYDVVDIKGFNRVGGFGWWFSGQVMKRKSLSPGQMSFFELMMPLVKFLENFPIFRHNSYVVIGEKVDEG